MRFERIQRALLRTRVSVLVDNRQEQHFEVTAAQAAVLRDAVEVLMSGYGDIAIALGQGRWVEARRLRWRFECLARLVDDLGWSPESTATAITMPPDQLLIALEAISRHCTELIEADRRACAEVASDVQSCEDGLAACVSLCQRLDVSGVADGGW